MLTCTQNLFELCQLCQFVLKILTGNKILTSFKGHNSVPNLLNNPNLDLVNVNVYTKFGQILSIHSQDIEQKLNSDINPGPKQICEK